ncbi:MAG: CPBP family intramembrane metalloprotease [Acidobacteriota bacterium]|nr:CPBP family intramembrane metalloprotease [Acidobacteriota bacterium]
MTTQPPLPDPPPTIIVPPLVDQRQQIASYWHTLLLVLLMLAISFSGQTRSKKTLSVGSRPLLYASAIAMQWTLVGVVWLGIRRRGYSIRQLTGRSWRSFDDVLIDVAIAAVFWIGSVAVLAALGFLMGVQKKIPEMRKAIEFMAPANVFELGIFFLLAVSAGVCEEILFRGYLQRQFAALSKSMVVGVLASAAVFGASHLYEGKERMVLVGILGAMLGTLAVVRKNLRPSMIAHTWQDVFAGVGLFVMRRLGT